MNWKRKRPPELRSVHLGTNGNDRACVKKGERSARWKAPQLWQDRGESALQLFANWVVCVVYNTSVWRRAKGKRMKVMVVMKCVQEEILRRSVQGFPDLDFRFTCSQAAGRFQLGAVWLSGLARGNGKGD